MSGAPEQEPSAAKPARSELARWQTPIALFVLTFLSVLYVGAGKSDDELLANPLLLLSGWPFAVPLMAILLAHEMGHYVAGRLHRIEISPPYFIPMPLVGLLGTMGAVIRMGRITRRNALLDVGAAGPLAGMVVALPVLIYGLYTSDVIAIPEDEPNMFVEGRGVLYLALLYALKGPIPAGYDIWLNDPAKAGWAGLLVTQINLIPVGQLDGGHVAYALFGKKQDGYARWIHRLLPVVGVGTSLAYVAIAYSSGERGAELVGEAMAGWHWVLWAIVLVVLSRLAGSEHPPTEPEPLTRGRKLVAIGTLVLFALVFMPSWIYVPTVDLPPGWPL
jgi:membrane-associated protease RseP (regulator of RpoE activity)